MAKLLPIAALVAALVASLMAWTMNGPALTVLVLLVAILGGVACILERTPAGIGVGIALMLLGVLAVLFGAGSLGGANAGLDFTAVDVTFREAVFPVLVLLAVTGALLLRWDTFRPNWLSLALAGGILLAAVLTFVFASSLGNPASLSIVPALAALLLAIPAILLLRAPASLPAGDEPAPAAAPRARKAASKR